ncbi:TPA: hypothetical protein HA244_01435 [Candidatus Micrarchaeota archaeon]|nr:hypothetical protein [Candidatus Micrarchaeota archaeon]
MKNEYFTYGLLFMAVLVLAWTVFSVFSKPKLDLDAQGKVLETASNEQYFQQQAAQVGNECGNLKDEATVQHLSHHPSQYAQCLRQVDPAFLKQATGKTLGELLG